MGREIREFNPSALSISSNRILCDTAGPLTEHGEGFGSFLALHRLIKESEGEQTTQVNWAGFWLLQ